MLRRKRTLLYHLGTMLSCLYPLLASTLRIAGSVPSLPWDGLGEGEITPSFKVMRIGVYPYLSLAAILLRAALHFTWAVQ